MPEPEPPLLPIIKKFNRYLTKAGWTDMIPTLKGEWIRSEDYSGLEAKIVEMDEVITTSEEATAALEGTITTLESTVTSLEETVTNLETTLSARNSQIASLRQGLADAMQWKWSETVPSPETVAALNALL